MNRAAAVHSRRHTAIYAAIFLYLLIVTATATFLRNNAAGGGESIMDFASLATNLIPLTGIADALYHTVSGHNTHYLIPLVNNFLVLCPVGFLIGAIDREKMPRLRDKALVCGAFTFYMAFLAAARLLMRKGSFDIDDILLNFIGIAVGMFLGGFLAKTVIEGTQQSQS